MNNSNSDLIYKQKYLKYKRKYIQLKNNNNLSGGWGEGEIIICYNKSAMEDELKELRENKDKYKNKNLDQNTDPNEDCKKRDLGLDWSDTKKLFSNFEGTKIYSKNKKKLIPLVSLGMLKRIINNSFLLKCFSELHIMKAEVDFIQHIKNKDAEIKNNPSLNTGNFKINSPYEKKELVLGPLDLNKGETYLQKIILDKYPKPEDLSSKIKTINNLIEICDKSNYATLLTELNCDKKCDSVMHLQFNKFDSNKIIYNNLVISTVIDTEIIKFNANNKKDLEKVITNNMSDATSFMSTQEKIDDQENKDPTGEISITGGSDISETQEGGKPFFLIILILIAVMIIAKLSLNILRQIIKAIFKTMKEWKEIKNS
jgi:hypothetical protein